MKLIEKLKGNEENVVSRVKNREERGSTYPGCLYYLSANGNDRVYYCSFRRGRKNVTAKFGEKSKGFSLKQCSLFRAKLESGEASTRKEKRVEEQSAKLLTLECMYKKYYEDRGGKGRDDSRFRKYLRPFWKDTDISQSTNEDMASFRTWLDRQISSKGTNLSPQSVKHCIALFRRILLYTQKSTKGFIVQINDFSMPKVKNETTEDLSRDELKRLVHVLESDQVNRPVCDMLLLMLNTGMRRGEVLKLMWSHVSFDRSTILLKKPKGGIDIVIPINKGARCILNRQKKTSMFVFPGVNGQRRRHIDKQARRLRDMAGLPKDFRPCHGLRHFYGTELNAQGVSLPVISELLGHKSFEVTKRYLKGRDQQKIEAVELITIGVSE